MKKATYYICFILVISFLMSVPVSAQTEIETRESMFFAHHATVLEGISDTRFKIWYDVTAVGTMDELGVCKIEVDHSTDGANWEEVAEYTDTFYPAMVASDTFTHTGYITYYGAQPGYYYRAYVTFYAKNSLGTGRLSRYTATLQM